MEDGFINARLEFWEVVHILVRKPEFYYISGRIFEDSEYRWPDGAIMHTSLVITPLAAIGQDIIVQTLNSRYLLTVCRMKNKTTTGLLIIGGGKKTLIFGRQCSQAPLYPSWPENTMSQANSNLKPYSPSWKNWQIGKTC